MRRVLLAAAAMALSVGILAAIGGVAAAKGKPTPVTATGNTTCNYHGQLVLNSDSTLSLSGNLTPHQGPACTSTGGSKLRAGHMNQTLPTTIPTTATDLCPFVAAATSLSVPLPDLLGGDIAWSPRAKVAGSTGVRLVGGSLSVSGTSLVLTYLFSSVASAPSRAPS